MKCPVCTNTSLLMSDRQGIEIDYCPQCRGVWLDRGELDKIIDRSALEAAPEPRQEQRPPQGQWQQPPGYGQQHYPYKKKKSLLGELFDF